MARALNQANLIGNVGQDPELRTTTNGSRCATFSLATSREWKNANGEKQEQTDWHRCVVWNRGNKGGLADVVEQYVKKGDKLYVSGRIEYRQWTDKENNTRYTTEIVVNELLMLGGKSQDGAASQAEGAMPAALQDEDDSLPF